MHRNASPFICIFILLAMLLAACAAPPTSTPTLTPTSPAPSLTFSPQATPTITLTATRTQTLTRTATATPTLTPAGPQLGSRDFWIKAPFVLGTCSEGLCLGELETGRTRIISYGWTTLYQYYGFFEWADDGCGFYAWNYPKSSIWKFNLNGQLIQGVYWRKENNIPGYEWLRKEDPSPNLKYAAIIGTNGEVIGGGWDDPVSAEQDLFTRNIATNEIIPISRNKGAYVYVWAPDGERIVYTDFDDDRQLRLYVSRADGTEQQMISSYPVYKDYPEHIVWSPDGKCLAVAMRDPAGVDVLCIAENSHLRFENVIWHSDGTIERTVKSGLEFLNPVTGEVVGTGPFEEREPDFGLEFYERNSSPAAFPGEENCSDLNPYTTSPSGAFTPAPTKTRTITPSPTVTPILLITPATATYGSRIWEQDGMEQVFVPAGEFEMGAADKEKNEKPVHTVYVDGFWIDKYEVSNAQYQQCVLAGKCTDVGYRNTVVADFPVTDPSWDDAVAYCAMMGKRLPTEAEWEKAARGTDGRNFPWGNEAPSCRLANYGDCAVNRLEVKVGSYPAGASPYGALDMAGNVWEWVSDWYQEDYYSISPYSNPTGPESGVEKVVRGGGFYYAEGGYYIRTTVRFGFTPTDQPTVGFRCLSPAAR